MTRPDEIPCPHCERGPFVDLVKHGAQYGGRARDLAHIQMAADVLRGELESRNTVIVQLAQEANDGDGDTNNRGGDERSSRTDETADDDGHPESVGDHVDGGDGPSPMDRWLPSRQRKHA
ncbi:hypothetical protein LCGC14_2588230 [marine sediment metagenome]|uniref:Uncharacterized protein n=1 Tax=marine sediment metagenome TaxID=412755 RepID=A0A0F9D582_9ZZZZ